MYNIFSMNVHCSDRLYWADLLRVFAICLVVILHTASPLLYIWTKKTRPIEWHIGNIIDSAVRSGVPLFIMLSGALLLGKEESIGTLLIFMISFVVTALGTYALSEKAGGFVEYFYAYSSLNVIAMAISVFLMIKFLAEKIERNNTRKHLLAMSALSQMSFGVYLIHPLVMQLLFSNINLSAMSFSPILSIPLTALMTLAISFLSIFLLSKIPGAGHVI